MTTIHVQSDEYYKYHTKYPVYGSRQGSGNIGSEWSFIIIPILKTMEKETDVCIIIGTRGQEWKKISQDL